MEYTITAQNGDSVRVESDNWLIAMGKAFGFFDVEPGQVASLVCSRQEDGAVQVREEAAGRGWVVRIYDTGVSAAPGSRSAREKWERIQSHQVVDDFDPNAAAPDIQMPESLLRPQDAQTVAERIFDLSMEIDAMSPEQAADAALDIARGATGAEAACVALGTLDAPHLMVVGARGVGGPRIFGRIVHFGEGLIGMCFDMVDVIAVPDVDAGTPHVDQLAGDGRPALAVLCVPIVDAEGTARGVVQLLNSVERPFTQSDVDTVRNITTTLANSLAER